MMRLVAVTVLVFGFALAFPLLASAQADPCPIDGESCLWQSPVGLILAPPIPIDAVTGTGLLFCVGWSVQRYSCVKPQPQFASETCTTCSDEAPAKPINLSTGDTYIVQTDVSVPGLGGGLVLTRTWNSILPVPQRSYGGMFGRNWRTNLEERLIYNSPDKFLKFSRGDGSVWSFATETAGTTSIGYRTVGPANDLTRINSGDVIYTLVAKDGSKKLFDSNTGLLTSLVDRNGNTTQLTYDTTNRLTTVTDAASRHLYFAYPNPVTTLVSSVTSDVGITFSYTYDDQGRLVLVTKPDNTKVSFEYDANSMIIAVRDNEDKLLEGHTYDALGRGLSATSANGVESVTVTYP
jgi:YD repeat-containing protein